MSGEVSIVRHRVSEQDTLHSDGGRFYQPCALRPSRAPLARPRRRRMAKDSGGGASSSKHRLPGPPLSQKRPPSGSASGSKERTSMPTKQAHKSPGGGKGKGKTRRELASSLDVVPMR